jgi:GGDEF domain-containing protein
VLRDADVLVRWEADELLALLPATDRPGAERAAERLKEAVDGTPVRVGAAHWVGDTAFDLLARAQPR